jgi:hypothetical protein
VIIPAERLRTKVAIRRHTANDHPKVETERKNISGSIEGEAIQKAITGPKGTPAINRENITGITVQEQSGLTAPKIVAKRIEIQGFFPATFLILSPAPLNFKNTETGIEISRKGQTFKKALPINSNILKISVNIIIIYPPSFF